VAGKPQNGDVVVSGYFDSTLTGVRKPEAPENSILEWVPTLCVRQDHSLRKHCRNFGVSSPGRGIERGTEAHYRFALDFLMYDEITEDIPRANHQVDVVLGE
jgi:hypothetical protein